MADEGRVSAPGEVGSEARIPLSTAVLVAVIGPFAVAALLALLRGVLENTSSALILVLVVVAGACTGYRLAGMLSAVSAGLWFDFFLTAPYHHFAIDDRGDIETMIVLVLIGAVLNEIIQWARRRQAQLHERDRYLAALVTLSAVDRTGLDGGATVTTAAAGQIRLMLDLDACDWVDTIDPDAPVLDRDGEVRDDGRRLAVDADGWPVASTVMLPLRPGASDSAAFALSSASHVARPSLRQRQLAGAMADQVASLLTTQRPA